MKFVGLDDREYGIDITQYSSNSESENKSGPHLRCRKLLKELFPLDVIIEEFPLPGSKGVGRKLFSDFIIPARKIMIEVHGKQHFEYCSFFHESKVDFIKGQRRDKDKKEWAEKNGINLIILKDTDKEDDWRKQIRLR